MRWLLLLLVSLRARAAGDSGRRATGRAPSSDPPGSHGMLVVGTDVVYLSHPSHRSRAGHGSGRAASVAAGGGAGGAPQTGELKAGDIVPLGTVQRVIYTEYGDLAQ